MTSTTSVTGESLHEEEVDDVIPGASPFFKVDLDDVKSEDFVPLDRLPSNPHEYLKSVMLEARHTPAVVVAKIDPSKIKPKTKPVVHPKYRCDSFMYRCSMDTLFHKQINEKTSTNSVLVPTREWQENQLANFATTRAEYIRHLANLKSINRQTKKRPKLPIYPLPPWDDEESWKLLCFGKSLTKRKKVEENEELEKSNQESDESSDNDNKRVQDAMAASGRTTVDILADQITDDDRIVDLDSLEEGFPPMMRILLRMDPNHVEANLEYHTRWLEEDGFSHEQGRWIYALLACLEKPLFPTVISVLRDLSRKSIELRSQINSKDDVYLSGLNLIICIVGRYFEQTDLSDLW